MQDKVWSEFRSLPVEAQRQVADFIAFLHERHERSTPRGRPIPDWDDEPFVGMWRDREEMENSTAWVRRTRQHEWGEPVG